MMKKGIAILLGAGVMAAAITGCGVASDNAAGGGASAAAESADSQSAGSEAGANGEYQYGKIDIPALDGSLCGAPIYIAYENGIFADHGIDANLTAADFETRKIGLNNGNVPFVNGDFQFFASAEQGIDMKIVGGMHMGCIKLVVREDSDIQSPADVKGGKIGVDEVGGTTFQVASVWLEEGGVSALQEDEEVTFLPYSDGNLELQALYDGDIDIAAVWDPLGDLAVNTGKAKVLLDIAEDEPFAGKYCCFYYASSKVLDENPELIQALYDSVLEAQEWINDNPEKAVDLIAAGGYSEIEDKELAAELISCYEFETMHHESGHDVRADVAYFADKLKEIGYLESDGETFADQFYQGLDQ